MSLQYLDLGEASFVSTKAGLMVEIKASAGLYHESGEHLGVIPSEHWGELAICEDIWVCKSHDFRLSFILSSDPGTTHSTGIEEEHLEEIENSLEGAQLWKQLALQPALLPLASPSDRPFEPSRRQFSLALRGDLAGAAHNGSDGPKPVELSDVANLRAPDRIRTIQLVSVLIYLRFQKVTAQNARESCAKTTSEPLPSTTGLLPGEDEKQDGQPALAETSQTFESLLDNDDFGPWNALMGLDCPSNVTATIPGRKTQIVSKTMVHLTDIALRTLICPGSKRPPRGTAPCKENNLFHLVNLAPSIFVPDYCDAVQSRVKLIPTIARFLSKHLQQSGQQTQSERNSCGSNASSTDPAIKQKYISEQKETLKRDLWMTLANGVKNVESARKLQPLHIARTGGAHKSPFGVFEDLLETWRPCDDDLRANAFEDDFEDLEMETLADSGDEYFSDLYDEALARPVTGVDDGTDDTTELFGDGIPKVFSKPSLLDGTLGTTSDLAYSISEFDHVYEHAAASVVHPGSGLSRTTGEDLQPELESSAIQVGKATQSRISTSQSPDVIGGNAYSHTYESRMQPSYTSQDRDSFMAEHLLFEQLDRHDFDVVWLNPPFYERSTTIEKQTLVGIDEDQDSTLLDVHDIEMPSYEKINRSSLTEIIGGDHLLWQMWTKRRPSMIQTDDDMLEMHDMYAQDPDMRIFDTHEAAGDALDDYMLELDVSKTDSINSKPPSVGEQHDFMFPYGPTKAAEQKNHHPFRLRTDSSPTSSQSDTNRPTSKGKLNRGQSFLRRLSGTRASTDEVSDTSRRFNRDEPQDIETKRRKTLADYDKSLDGDDMLLS